MDKITTFDVIVVYSERLAASANSLSEDVTAPFAKGSANESYNLVYSYFLKICQKKQFKSSFFNVCRYNWCRHM